MKTNIFLFFIFLNSFLFGLDTIRVCNSRTTMISFSDSIEIFEAGTKKLQINSFLLNSKLLELQSTVSSNSFIPTNYFIKTVENNYNFEVLFSCKISDSFNFFYDFKTKKRNIVFVDTVIIEKKDVVVAPIQKIENKIKMPISEDSFIFLYKNKKTRIFGAFEKKNKVALSFEDLIIENGFFYFKFLLKNNSDIFYFVDLLNLSKNQAMQEEQVEIVKSFSVMDTFLSRKSTSFILKTKPFSIKNSTSLKLLLSEKEGERKFSILIPSFIVNYPNKITY